MFIQSVPQAAQKKKKTSAPNRSWTYDLLVTTPDALPLSYKRLISDGSRPSDKRGGVGGGGGGVGGGGSQKVFFGSLGLSFI